MGDDPPENQPGRRRRSWIVAVLLAHSAASYLAIAGAAVSIVHAYGTPARPALVVVGLALSPLVMPATVVSLAVRVARGPAPAPYWLAWLGVYVVVFGGTYAALRKGAGPKHRPPLG